MEIGITAGNVKLIIIGQPGWGPLGPTVMVGYLGYGNFGGKNFMGGVYSPAGSEPTQQQLTTDPVDALDRIFKVHDIAYTIAPNDKAIADRQLVLDIENLKSSADWGTMRPEEQMYANLAQRYFDSESVLGGVTSLVASNWLSLFRMLAPGQCFPAGTMINATDGSRRPIESIFVGETVLAFDSSEGAGRGALRPARVTKLFEGVTDQWLEIRPIEGSGRADLETGFETLTVTPGHRFLSADGGFRRIDEILASDGRVVLADGSITQVTARHIVYSAETAHLYEEAERVECASTGGLALAPVLKKGWKTYNFEVEGLHTYVADGARVHNDSTFTLVGAADEFFDLFHRPFDGSEHDVNLMMGAIFDGRITAYGDYAALLSDDRYTMPATDFLHDKIVFSADQLGYSVSTVHNMDGGGRFYTVGDPGNSFNWNREVVAVHPDFIDRIVVNDNGTVGSATYYGATLTGEIGSALGSSLGRLLGGNSLVGQVAAGTVIGTIGKEIGNALYYGGTYTLDVAVKDAFGTLGGGSGVGALPSAAIGAASSLLMAELAQSLHLSGWEGWAFTTTGTSITTQLVTNAYGMATGATWGNGNPYTMYTGFDPASIATNLGTVVATKLASTLVSQVVVPYYPEGAVGQQIGASVGGSIGATLGAVALVGIPVVGPVMGAYIGSFLGTIVGSILGDLAGNDPESHGRVVFFPDGRFYPDPTSFTSANGASGDPFKYIATHTAFTLNALADFAGVTMSAFPVDANPISNALGLQLLYTQDNHYWMINEPFQGPLSTVAYPHGVDELSPLINTGITTLAHRVTVAGGDPLVRLAWQNSPPSRSTCRPRRTTAPISTTSR